METRIQVIQASKSFRQQTVFEDVNITVKAGEIVGIVGQNGSGKTVLFKSILGLIPLNKGEIQVNGEMIGKDTDVPKSTGAIIENPGFLTHQSGFQNLQLLASIHGKITNDDIRRAIDLVGLDPHDERPVSNYSMGMRQRLGLAQALMENPDVLILDEALNGLDSQGVREMREILLQCKANGQALLITSHTQEDIDILCDRVFQIKDAMFHQIR